MSTLSVLIEASANSWGKLATEHGDRTIGIILRALVSFCNAHLAQSASNQLLVFAYGRNIEKKMIFSSSRPDDRETSTVIVKRLREILTRDAQGDEVRVGVPLGPALAHAFCHMKKTSKTVTADQCADSLGPQTVSTGEPVETGAESITTRAVLISMTPISGAEHAFLGY
uniref:General transcription factor IIH subunit 3 n=1 Tax=Caenorhabditis japonica TaxID=281687 RepID=A0A8R1EVF0_CAEJA